MAGTALPAAAWPPAIPNATTGSASPAGSFAGRLLPPPPVPGAWQQGQGRDRAAGTAATPRPSNSQQQIRQVSNAAGLIPHNCVLWGSLPNPGVLQPEGMEELCGSRAQFCSHNCFLSLSAQKSFGNCRFKGRVEPVWAFALDKCGAAVQKEITTKNPKPSKEPN